MRILYITTIGSTMDFFKSLIKELIDDGNVVDIATNESEKPVSQFFKDLGCKVFPIDTSRSPLSTGNIRAIKQIKSIAKDYDIVHCHTPIASIATRLACKSFRKNGLKVIYTAHGFHFYKGVPLKNWLIYYPIEKICAHWTDVLITINKEDYELAKKKMKAKRVEYVPGVGIDTKKFSCDIISEEEKIALRNALGITSGEKIFLSVGELSKRKNHEVVLKALSKWKHTDYKYYIVGKGELKEYLEDKIHEYGLTEHVFLLGYRNDISALCSIADLFIFPSLQEGLPVALMEAIASKVTVICSRIRGSEELVTEDNMFSATNSDEVKDRLEAYITGDLEETVVSNYKTLRQFDLEKVNQDMENLYGGIEQYGNLLMILQAQRKRREIGVLKDAKMLLSVGELNENKNHKVVIEALGRINDSNIHYVIAGVGDQKENLENLAKYINVNLHLLGYRKDVAELYKCADLYVLPSIREGLNVSVMEALASGLPVICSKIRGNVDMVHDGVNGYLFDPKDLNSLIDLIKKSAIASWDDITKTAEVFNFSKINNRMLKIYEEC